MPGTFDIVIFAKSSRKLDFDFRVLKSFDDLADLDDDLTDRFDRAVPRRGVALLERALPSLVRALGKPEFVIAAGLHEFERAEVWSSVRKNMVPGGGAFRGCIARIVRALGTSERADTSDGDTLSLEESSDELCILNVSVWSPHASLGTVLCFPSVLDSD
mmetsp:Transcript_4476/g.8739  ORF Transcript_4476/g.8739 Transcript_4476/m.8739 type:complete len:160 (-) Transcript_4476:733-1212(-)